MRDMTEEDFKEILCAVNAACLGLYSGFGAVKRNKCNKAYAGVLFAYAEELNDLAQLAQELRAVYEQVGAAEQGKGEPGKEE